MVCIRIFSQDMERVYCLMCICKKFYFYCALCFHDGVRNPFNINSLVELIFNSRG